MINYDFSNLMETLAAIKAKFNVAPEDLRNIKAELNKFFSDASCREVLYTTNTDKMFFGLKVIPTLNEGGYSIYEYISENEPIRIKEYIVEFDSKLFDPVMDLDTTQLTAILIYEISRLVNDASPIENARDTLNAYLYENKDSIKISQSLHYQDILKFGLRDYLSKYNSFFYVENKDDLYSNEFLNSYGLAYDLGKAYEIVSRNYSNLYANAQISKFAVFAWTLSVYRNIKIRRVGSIRTLARAKQLTASRLEQREMENLINRIKRIDDNIVLEANMKEKIAEKKRKHRLSNLKMIEGTYCELLMQVRNVEEEADALYLMRVINNNISILSEYEEEETDEYMKERWRKVLDQFMQLREKLANTTVYKNKNYGVFVNYPDIVENRY